LSRALTLLTAFAFALPGCAGDTTSANGTEAADALSEDAPSEDTSAAGGGSKDVPESDASGSGTDSESGDSEGSTDAASDSESPKDSSSADPGEEGTTDGTTPDPDAIEEEDDPPDEAPDFLDLGEPIEAPPLEWTWIPFSEAICGDGSSTGLGINLSPGATRALIYLEGGGACWDWNTCFGILPTSFHLSGYDENEFNGLLTSVYLNTLIFNRDEPKNPLRDAHLVFIPYCTGDAHAGDQVLEIKGLFPWENETMHFKGHSNLIQFLNRLVPTFSDVDHLVLAGGSAGGFGAGINWPWVAAAFGSGKRVDLLDDSGPPLEPAGDLWQTWMQNWGLVLPPGCPECDEGLPTLLDHLRETVLVNNRMGLASFTHDPIISVFFTMLPFQFAEKLKELTAVFNLEPNAQYFILPGALHTMTIGPGYEFFEAGDGMPLWFWVEQMISDDPEWGSHGPW